MSRTAVVTGAARGLGEAIARRLAADGDRVLLADIDEAGAARVAREIGGEAVEHDVRSLESWERLLAAAGEVDVLVNNAARTEIRPFWEIDVDEWDDVLATNLRGTYLGIRVLGAQMRDRGAGRIVNLTSVAGQNSRAVTGVHYASSKAAIVALTRHAATELAGSGVTVNAVAPAAIDGPMVATVAPERLEAMLKTIPVGRLGRPDEVAAAVAYLASDAAGFVTGATLDVNGGMLIAMKMRAAVMHEPGALVVEELDVEEPLPGEVVVRMSAVGVCGTDLHSYKGEWDRPTPIVLGHEGAGLVEAVGSEVEGLREGDRVVLSWAPACGECGPCRRGRPAACGPLSSAIGRGTLLGGRTGLTLNGETVFRGTATGALAERVVVDCVAAMPFGDDVPMEQAALLGCAALTGVGAVLNAARPEPGFSALVIGAGGVGQFVVQGARIAGAAEILVVDPVEARRARALELGATRACAPDDVREAVGELDLEGVDYAFDAVGAAATTKLALRWTRGGGTAVVVGLPAGGEKLELDPFEFSNREKTLTGTIYGSEDPAVALPQLLDLVASGRLELASLVGPSFPLDRADDAFRASLAGEPGRVLVTP